MQKEQYTGNINLLLAPLPNAFFFDRISKQAGLVFIIFYGYPSSGLANSFKTTPGQ